MTDILADLLELHERKYKNKYLQPEFMQIVAVEAELSKETSTIRARLRDNVYGLFSKEEDTGELSGEGQRIMSGCRVSSIHRAQSTSNYCLDACINMSPVPVEDYAGIQAKKRKRVQLRPIVKDRIQLWYHFEESSMTSAKRGDKIRVMKSPCKIISMSVWASHGAGLDKVLLCRYVLYTAGESPSHARELFDINYTGDNLDLDNRYSTWKADRGIADEGGDENDDEHDTCDYYNVYVNHSGLIKVSQWMTALFNLSRKSIFNNGNGENLLVFLLSITYVDEAWGIHDGVLDYGYPETEEDGNSNDSESGADCD